MCLFCLLACLVPANIKLSFSTVRHALKSQDVANIRSSLRAAPHGQQVGLPSDAVAELRLIVISRLNSYRIRGVAHLVPLLRWSDESKCVVANL